jgi:hypothetical protein
MQNVDSIPLRVHHPKRSQLMACPDFPHARLGANILGAPYSDGLSEGFVEAVLDLCRSNRADGKKILTMWPA